MTLELGYPIGKGEGFALYEEESRFLGTYILGNPRQGKTTFMLNLMKHEMEYAAIIVVDPHGDLALSAASLAPKDRLVYVDKDHPLVINPLDRPELPYDQLAKELVEVINAVTTTLYSNVEITHQMEDYYVEALRVIDRKDMNLFHLYNFLNFSQYRKETLNGKDDYWRRVDSTDKGDWEYKRTVDSLPRCATRLATFFKGEMGKFTIGRNQFNVKDIAEQKKIVCFNLDGFLEPEKAFLGNVISHAVKSFVYNHPKQFMPLFFYMDEFHLFITRFFNAFLTEAPKKYVSFNVSHHNHQQTPRDVLDSLLSTCDLKAVFNCGHNEAKRMSQEYQVADHSIFMNLKKHHAYLRINGKNHKVETFPPPEFTPYVPTKAKYIPPPIPDDYDLGSEPRAVNFLRNGTFPV